MKKKYIILLIVLIVTAALFFWYIRSKEEVPSVTFITAKPQYGFIAKSVTATGNVEPDDTVSVGAQVSGVVKKVWVDFNSVVKKGQLLAQVDPSILASQNQESIANLANAKSNLALQQGTFERQNKLFNLDAISKADYQLALNLYNSAKAAVDNAAAQLKVTEKTLYYTNIYSPVNGVVLNRNISEGQTIASSFSAPVLFVIAKDLTKMQVNADVDEADIGGVKSGQNVTFTVDAFPDDVFAGTVLEIYLHPSVSANVVTYSTLINVDNTSMKLKPGMTASINIYTDEDSSALLIPSRAISFKPDTSLLSRYKVIKGVRDTAGVAKANILNRRDTTKRITREEAGARKSYVWVKTGDTLTEKRIITSINDGSYVKVIKGLSPGDEIVTNTVKAGNKNKADNIQHSPFMPQPQRRPASNPRN